MSPKLFNSSGGKGRRTPGKPGRFDPSEPLHMTTRHAARNGRVNDTPSINGSVDGDESRRGSIDDARPITSYTLSNHHDAKGRRASRTSLQDAPDANRSFEMLPSDTMQSARSKSKPISPTLHPLSPSRKRKRSSPTPPQSPNDSLHAIETNAAVTDAFDDEYLETVPASQVSDREGSVATASSGEQYQRGYAGVTQSTEFTPVVSEAVSPVSEDSNIDAVTPEKQIDVVLTEPDPVNEQEGDDVEDLAEADDAEDVDDGDDIDDQTRADADGRPRRRFAGRRRADHPIPEIEAMLRRQLRLKSAYRNISRALKPVLAELAQKTIEDLEADPSLHLKVVEYRGDEDEVGVERQLENAIAKRKNQLDAQLRWNEFQLNSTLSAEAAARSSKCELQIEDARQVHFQHLAHEFLAVARRAQMSSGEPGYETDDEDDDILPKLKGMAYRFQRTGVLDPKYDSRSRLAMETEFALEALQKRFEMHSMLQDLDESARPDRHKNFTVMDAGPRDAAVARRESLLTTRMLAEAAVEFERISSIPVIPNEEAIGLQMLGDLASRPSIRASTAAANIARYDKDVPPSFVPFQPLPHHVRRSSTAYEGPNFDMSPRSQPVQERVGPQFFPPATPKYHAVPETIPREPRMLSPTFSPGRSTNMLPPLAVRPVDDDHMAPPDSPPRYPRPIEHFERNMTRTDMIDPALTSMQFRSEPSLPRPSHIDVALYNPNHVDHPTLDFSRTRSDGPEKAGVSGNGLASQHLRSNIPDELSRDNPVLPKPEQIKAPESPRASEALRRGEQSAENKIEIPMDLPKTRSRNSSVSQSATDVSPEGSRAGDIQRRPKQKSARGPHAGKSGKGNKNGLSQRVWKTYRPYDPKRGSPPPENGPSIHRFRLNSVEQTPQSQTYQLQATPGQPVPVWPPGYYYPQPPLDPYGPPPPPFAAPAPFQSPHHAYPYGGYHYDFPPPYQPQAQPQHQHQHRNSFSGPPPNWPQQPGSPLYAVPAPPPAAPGASPEQWPSQAAQVPPAGCQTPTTSHAQSAPGTSYVQPYPGPPIAPATPDHRYAGYGAAPAPVNHPPAFAQQQRQSDGGHRRRTQSDAQNPRFQQWTPRPT